MANATNANGRPAGPGLRPASQTCDSRWLAERLPVLAAAFLVYGCLSLLFDVFLSTAFLAEAGPIWAVLREGLQKLVHPAEAFANGLGVLMLLMVLWAADVGHRRGLLRATIVIFGTGLLANVGKMLVARIRPRVFFDYEMGTFPGGVVESFQGWLPLASFGYAGQSIPSGHTSTAVALAIVLCRRWPQASWAFVTLACLSAMQRIAFGHHYLSDCFLGASLACVIGTVFYHPSALGKFFDRFEARRAGRNAAAPTSPSKLAPAAPSPATGKKQPARRAA